MQNTNPSMRNGFLVPPVHLGPLLLKEREMRVKAGSPESLSHRQSLHSAFCRQGLLLEFALHVKKTRKKKNNSSTARDIFVGLHLRHVFNSQNKV